MKELISDTERCIEDVLGIPYNSVMKMKMMMMAKGGDLHITAISSYVRGLIFITVTNVDSGWRKLHNEELHDVHSSPNIICVIKSRMMRWAGHVACISEKCIHRSGGEPEGNISLRRPGHREADNIKMDLKESE
jgi:hypothetical protein